MTTTEQPDHDAGWERIGRATEHFARRIARDAGKFAERLQGHAGEFADDLSRDWRRARRAYRHSCRRAYRAADAPEVREIFEDIRTVLRDVLDGVDELMERIFNAPGETTPHDPEWLRLVVNRAAECVACQRPINAGDEAFVRRNDETKEFRCLDCGVPSASTTE